MIRAFLGVLAMAATGAGVFAQGVSPALRSELAPTGTLRAGINYNNPLLARREAASGELGGIAVDLAHELGRRAGVPVQLVPYDAAGRMVDAVTAGAWDVAFLAIDPGRAAAIDFTAPYIEIEGTYLVPAGSPLRGIEDVDRPGVRIAVTAKSGYDLYLSRVLKHAQLVRAGTTPESIELMHTQRLDAVAAVRTALVAAAAGMAGSRVLDGHFMTIPQAAAVPRGRPAATRFVRQFIEEMKASGFVAAALTRHGLQPHDAIVAPPSPVP
jgi:polar amino acid transport system substrate-binding protein